MTTPDFTSVAEKTSRYRKVILGKRFSGRCCCREVETRANV